MVTIIILALLIYGIFQFTKYLMSATVNHAQSHIAGSWGVAKTQPRAERRPYHLHQISYGIRACSAAIFDLLFVIPLFPCRCARPRKSPVLECTSGIAARQLCKAG